MTVAAGFSTGLAYFSRNLEQIHCRVRHPCGFEVFFICSGGIMAYQAVDPALVAKVKVRVFPTITGMTTRATGPVAEDADAEIVDGYGTLAKINSPVLTKSIWRRAFPQPVRGPEHLLALVRVATEALSCYLEGIRFAGKLHKVGMVPDSLFVAATGAPDGAPVELLVAARTLSVDSTFEPYTVRRYGVEGILMASRTAHGL